MLRASEWMAESPSLLIKGIVCFLQSEFVRKHKHKTSRVWDRVHEAYCQTLWHLGLYSEEDPDRQLTRAFKHHLRTDLIGKTTNVQVWASPKSIRRNYIKCCYYRARDGRLWSWAVIQTFRKAWYKWTVWYQYYEFYQPSSEIPRKMSRDCVLSLVPRLFVCGHVSFVLFHFIYALMF